MSTREPLRILTVCTGNICRSPMAQFWMRAALPGDDVQITSAGINAMIGRGMDAPSALMTERFGGDPSSHVARQLDERILAETDLVIAMAVEHREAAVAIRPALARRAFTILELEALIAAERFSSLRKLAAEIDGSPRARLAAMLDALAMRRADVRRSEAESYDVVDPFRRGDEVVQRAVAQLLPAVETVVEFLRTVTPPTPNRLQTAGGAASRDAAVSSLSGEGDRWS